MELGLAGADPGLFNGGGGGVRIYGFWIDPFNLSISLNIFYSELMAHQ